MPGRFTSLADGEHHVDSVTGASELQGAHEWVGFGVGTRTVQGTVHRVARCSSGARSGETGHEGTIQADDDQAKARQDRASGPGDPTESLFLSDPEALRQRLEGALTDTARDLVQLQSVTSPEVGEILGAQAMMAEDPTLVDRLLAILTPQLVEAKVGEAGIVVRRIDVVSAFATLAEELRAVGGYIGERADDINEIGARACDVIFETSPAASSGQADAMTGDGSILVFDTLAAADAARLDSHSVRGVIVKHGGPTGHAALILRSLDIAALMGCGGASDIAEGLRVELDPVRGRVSTQLGSPERQGQGTKPRATRVRSMLATGAVQLLANVGSVADATEASTLGASGVGLVRTEFLFASRDTEPDVMEQASTYRAIAGPFEGSGYPVIVRTLDVGSDKPLSFVDRVAEENPALGVRGFRLAGVLPGLLERQLEALALANEEIDGVDLRVMAPMISTKAEVIAFVAMARAVALPKAGVMIEVPAMALDFASAAALVDFASIGTNDLVQYLMGADRNAPTLGQLLDPWSPVVLRLIHSVSRAGARTRVPISVCGEAASDPLLAVVLAGLGVTSLSMTPVALGPVLEMLDGVSLTTAKRLSRRALGAEDASTARTAVAEALGLA